MTVLFFSTFSSQPQLGAADRRGDRVLPGDVLLLEELDLTWRVAVFAAVVDELHDVCVARRIERIGFAGVADRTQRLQIARLWLEPDAARLDDVAERGDAEPAEQLPGQCIGGAYQGGTYRGTF